MKQAAPNLNYYWAELLVEEIYRCGVRAVGLAPGSRSSPLAEAAASHRRLKLVVHPDERGLGFHMLGHALGSGRPAAVITTSGTAAANLFPAVSEAYHAGVPLLVITADRPPELRDCGANQATDQVKLFGSFVRSFTDLPVPTEEIQPAYLLSAVDAAIQTATAHPRGPVHLNAMFREPLAPVSKPYPYRRLQRSLGDWPKRIAPWVTYESTTRSIECPPELLQRISSAQRGLILAGALSSNAASSVLALAEHLGWPLLPDLQSGLRLGSKNGSTVAHADVLLASKRFARGNGCDLILQFGSGFVTRRFLDLAGTSEIVQRVVVDNAPGRVDPQHRNAARIQSEPACVADALCAALPARASTEWLVSWSNASTRVEREWVRRFSKKTTLSEPAIAWTLSTLFGEDDVWFVGNSLSIRMAATFSSSAGAAVPVAANRGLSGIDGQIATAVGYAAGSGRPVTLLVGDLTLFHDLNSLALLRDAPLPVTIVLVNNDGGGIFSLLPIADSARHFERVFGTPHGLIFRSAAKLFGFSYASPSTPDALARTWRAAQRNKHSTLIEINTRRADTARLVRRLVAVAASAIDRLPV